MAQSTYPLPHDSEMKVDYLRRLDRDPAVRRSHATPVKRRMLGEKLWAKAKLESLVSITTHKGEVLLFGRF